MFIEFDNSKIDSAVSDIENCIAEIDKIKIQADQQVVSMSNLWSGLDYEAFLNSFQGDNGVLSNIDSAKKVLQARADFLKFCSSRYKSVQANAINRALKIICL